MKYFASKESLKRSPDECLVLRDFGNTSQLVISEDEAERFHRGTGRIITSGPVEATLLVKLMNWVEPVQVEGEIPQVEQVAKGVHLKGVLEKFVDGKGTFGIRACWSIVRLPDGNPLWISIAKTGVLVMQTDSPPTGRTVVQVSGEHAAGQIALELSRDYKDEHVPNGMENLHLSIFSIAALESSDVEGFVLRIKKAANLAGVASSVT